MCEDWQLGRQQSQSVDRVAFNFLLATLEIELKLLTMTTLEIIFIIIFWVILGFFICYKRNWYEHEGADQHSACLFSVIFSPINFLITFVKRYFIESWKQ